MPALERAHYADLIGKPFAVRGRGPDRYDCFGLLIEIYRRLGIAVPDVAYDADADAHGALFERNARLWIPCAVEPGAVEPGAVLAFRRGRFIQHVGVALGNERFIHASEDIGSVLISRLDDPLRGFGRLLVGAYRHAV